MGSIGSNMWEPLVRRRRNLRFQDWVGIGSKVWEPLVPRTGNPWFQDSESLMTHLGRACSQNWEPMVSRLVCIGANVPSRTKRHVNAFFSGPLGKTTLTYFIHVC